MIDDERLGQASMNGNRQDRAMQDREVVEDRELTEAERLALFQQDHFQMALPDLPKKPGFHMIWLSTTSKSSPIGHMMKLGYKLCTPADVPGWDFNRIDDGAYEGYIGVNEMIAAMIPESLYQTYMKINHFDRPREQARSIYDKADQMNQAAQEVKGRVDFEEGMADFKQDGVKTQAFD